MPPSRSARLRRPRAGRLALLGAAALALSLGACSDGDAETTASTGGGTTTATATAPAPPPTEGLPPRTGDPVELAAGEVEGVPWAVTLQASEAGLCILIEGEAQMAEGCGFEVPERNAVASFRFPRDPAAGYAIVAGLASPEADTVRVELADGSVLEPDLGEDPTGSSGAAVWVAEVAPAQPVVAVSALAGEEVLQRREQPGAGAG